MKRSIATLAVLGLMACGDDSGSPTAPRTPSGPPPPPPQAKVTIDRLDFDVGIASISPPLLSVTYTLRIEETAGVAITLTIAHFEVFYKGTRIGNDRRRVDERIAGDLYR